MSKTDIGRRIKTVRSVIGMSQADLAKESDISENYLSNIEKGLAQSDLSIGVLMRIAKSLGAPVSVLLMEGTKALDVVSYNEGYRAGFLNGKCDVFYRFDDVVREVEEDIADSERDVLDND